MEEIKLGRTGKRPIGFVGEEIFKESTERTDRMRWHVIRVFRRQKGGFHIGIVRKTCMEGERDEYIAERCDNPQEVIDLLVAQNPPIEDLDIDRLRESLIWMSSEEDSSEPSRQTAQRD